MVLTPRRSPSFLRSQSLQLGAVDEWPKRSPPLFAVGWHPRFGQGSLNHPAGWGESSSDLEVEALVWGRASGEQEIVESSNASESGYL